MMADAFETSSSINTKITPEVFSGNQIFTLFSTLPQELQDHIWKFAILTQQSEGRVLSIAPDDNYFASDTAPTPGLEDARNAQIRIVRSKADPIHTPTLLHTCQRARSLSIEAYTLWSLFDPLSHSTSHRIYVNKAHDIFFFPGNRSYEVYWLIETIYASQNLRPTRAEISNAAKHSFLTQLQGVQNYAFDTALVLSIISEQNNVSVLFDELLGSTSVILVLRNPQHMHEWSSIRKLQPQRLGEKLLYKSEEGSMREMSAHLIIGVVMHDYMEMTDMNTETWPVFKIMNAVGGSNPMMGMEDDEWDGDEYLLEMIQDNSGSGRWGIGSTDDESVIGN